MLYQRKNDKELSLELFKNPPSEYRGAPFWAWDTELNKDILAEEIRHMKEMGFGGFYMHVRVGLSTPYLSDEFMDYIKFCVEEAKKNGMKAYLYDEDKWPSGFAGGLVTKDIECREKSISLRKVPYNDGSLTLASDIEKSTTELPKSKYYLVACFDINFDENGFIQEYKRIDLGEEATGEKWFAYMIYDAPTAWYNDQAYCDTLQKSVIEKFIKITHERYKEVVGDEFGKTINTIFTDEPQFKRETQLPTPNYEGEIIFPFTTDFDDTFKLEKGYSIIDKIPEIVWERSVNELSKARYDYHDHIAERFARAFSDTLGGWCEENNIHLTGHMMDEPDLESQSRSIGDCMRHYRGFGMPGIDMLADQRQLTTARQCQSAVRQYGREGMTSELYGVTNWTFDFKGYKLQGDWQAAMGVTHRTPHLYWLSMKGDAKRDYPPSIGHQSPWYKEYKYIEDHFSRLGTVLTRGKGVVKVGVIHPVESYWLRFGPISQTADYRDELEGRFYEFLGWMLYGTIDFDYVCESTLPKQYTGINDGKFGVGHMNYDAIIVPALTTIRKTTLDRLKEFKNNGGKVIFMGDIPKYVDAVLSDEAVQFAAECKMIGWSKEALFTNLKDQRDIEIRGTSGNRSRNLIYQMRQDGNKKYLFISHVTKPRLYDSVSEECNIIEIKGKYKVKELETLTGSIKDVLSTYGENSTFVRWNCYSNDSLLLELEEGISTKGNALKLPSYTEVLRLTKEVKYAMDEENVVLLDMPKYSVDGGEERDEKYICKISNDVKYEVGILQKGKGLCQPWIYLDSKEVEPKHTVKLKYVFDSKIAYDKAYLGIESLNYVESLKLNGVDIDRTVCGFYVDSDAIKKVKLPTLNVGENVLEIECIVSKKYQIEACYILGDFGVELRGTRSIIIPKPETLYIGAINNQGFPFYGGNITYNFDVELDENSALQIPKFGGTCLGIDVDGQRKGTIALPPNVLALDNVSCGKHSLSITVFGNRMNTFGSIHNVEKNIFYCSRDSFFSDGKMFTKEYNTHEIGLLTEPIILKK